MPKEKTPVEPEKVVADDGTDAAQAVDAVKAEANDSRQVVPYEGVDYTLVVSVIDDFDLVEDLAAYDAGNGLKLPGILEALLGPKQYAEAKARFADPETGRTPFAAMQRLFQALDSAMGK